MPNALLTKPCRICGAPVAGRRRRDRLAYYYPRQCPACFKVCKDEALRVARIKRIAAGDGNVHRHAVGATRVVKRGKRLYRMVKVGQPAQWRYEHRNILEGQLGRRLRRDEQVHHLNGNGLDNRPENLRVVDQGTHNRIEFTLPLGRWAKNFDACISCGDTARRHLGRGLCSACYQKEFGVA